MNWVTALNVTKGLTVYNFAVAGSTMCSGGNYSTLSLNQQIDIFLYYYQQQQAVRPIEGKAAFIIMLGEIYSQARC